MGVRVIGEGMHQSHPISWLKLGFETLDQGRMWSARDAMAEFGGVGASYVYPNLAEPRNG